MATEMSM